LKVYSYYNHVPEINDGDMIPIWEASWRKHGWDVVVLTEADAKRADPLMYDRINRSPLLETRNPREYTRAAMLRWIPMTQTGDPSIHVDIDVLCNGLRPEQIEIKPDRPTFLAGSTCPCAVAATQRGWKLFAAWLECSPYVPRFSAEALAADSCDQYATSIMPDEFFHIQPGIPCKLYTEQAGWETAPMIHFPNRLTAYPRSKTIRALGFG
jgi:hypothetical protein